MAKDWRVVIDDTGGPFSGWPLCVSSATEDRAVLHQGGFIQEFWGGNHGDGPSLREALEIAQLVANHMNRSASARG